MCATLKWKIIAVIPLVLCAAVASAVLMLRGARADLQEPVLNTAGSSSSFPVVEVYDHTGQKTDVLHRPSSRYKLLFSLTTSCQSCVEFLEFVRVITPMLSGPNIDAYVVWEDKIPLDRSRSYGLPDEMNLSMRGRRLTQYTPSVVILDTDGTVALNAPSLYISAITDKVLSLVTASVIDNAVTFLLEKYGQEHEQLLLYFSVDRCKPCEEERERVQQARNRFPDVRIVEIGVENKEDPDYLTDWGGLLAKVFGVERYPSHVLVDRDSRSYSPPLEPEDVPVWSSL